MQARDDVAHAESVVRPGGKIQEKGDPYLEKKDNDTKRVVVGRKTDYGVGKVWRESLSCCRGLDSLPARKGACACAFLPCGAGRSLGPMICAHASHLSFRF